MTFLDFFRLWLTLLVAVGGFVNYLEVYAARKMLSLSVQKGFDHIHIRVARGIRGEATWRFWTQLSLAPIVIIMWLTAPVPAQVWYAAVARLSLVVLAHLSTGKAVWARFERLEIMQDISADVEYRRHEGRRR